MNILHAFHLACFENLMKNIQKFRKKIIPYRTEPSLSQFLDDVDLHAVACNIRWRKCTSHQLWSKKKHKLVEKSSDPPQIQQEKLEVIHQISTAINSQKNIEFYQIKNDLLFFLHEFRTNKLWLNCNSLTDHIKALGEKAAVIRNTHRPSWKRQVLSIRNQ